MTIDDLIAKITAHRHNQNQIAPPIDSGGSDGYVALAAEFEVEVMPKSKI